MYASGCWRCVDIPVTSPDVMTYTMLWLCFARIDLRMRLCCSCGATAIAVLTAEILWRRAFLVA